MATENPIRIEDFPETTQLLSSDKLILFQESSGQLMPYTVEIYQLSALLVVKNGLSALSSEIDDFEKKYKEIERNFNNTYLTKAQISAEYSTINQFNDIAKKIEKTENFRNALSAKADTEFLDYQYNLLKAKVQEMKRYLGIGSWDRMNSNYKDDGKGYKVIMAGKALETPEE